MDSLYDLAKNMEPSELKIFRAYKNNEILYGVSAIRNKRKKDIFEDFNILIVEVHPLLKVTQFTDFNNTEKLKGTDFYNCLTNRFSLGIDLKRQTATFGPPRSIALDVDICGFGIGSYMLSKLIAWGKLNYSPFKVTSGKLSYSDAADPENKKRRNTCYKNCGFKLFPSNPNEGIFTADSLAELCQHINREKIEEIDCLITKTPEYPHFNLDKTITAIEKNFIAVQEFYCNIRIKSDSTMH